MKSHCVKIRTRKTSVFGIFLRSVGVSQRVALQKELALVRSSYEFYQLSKIPYQTCSDSLKKNLIINSLDQIMSQVLTLSECFKLPAIFATTFLFCRSRTYDFIMIGDCELLIKFQRVKLNNTFCKNT